VEQISSQHPETPKNTIHGSVWNLAAIFRDEIAKPSRGLFKPASTVDTEQGDGEGEGPTTTVAGVKLKEIDFYKPFAQWLKNDWMR
jgi:hypothetical protein